MVKTDDKKGEVVDAELMAVKPESLIHKELVSEHESTSKPHFASLCREQKYDSEREDVVFGEQNIDIGALGFENMLMTVTILDEEEWVASDGEGSKNSEEVRMRATQSSSQKLRPPVSVSPALRKVAKNVYVLSEQSLQASWMVESRSETESNKEQPDDQHPASEKSTCSLTTLESLVPSNALRFFNRFNYFGVVDERKPVNLPRQYRSVPNARYKNCGNRNFNHSVTVAPPYNNNINNNDDDDNKTKASPATSAGKKPFPHSSTYLLKSYKRRKNRSSNIATRRFSFSEETRTTTETESTTTAVDDGSRRSSRPRPRRTARSLDRRIRALNGDDEGATRRERDARTALRSSLDTIKDDSSGATTAGVGAPPSSTSSRFRGVGSKTDRKRYKNKKSKLQSRKREVVWWSVLRIGSLSGPSSSSYATSDERK